MEPRIETIAGKKVAGHRMSMSFAGNRTQELWRNFMSKRNEIQNIVGNDLYSIEVYPPVNFNNFNPGTVFEKWAAVEVTDCHMIPEGMETMILKAGLYAVFTHVGPASTGFRTYQYIFETWLPGSDYNLDDRPHFAVMGEAYKNEDPESREEIWIPVKLKVVSSPI